jgi:hypothetical protein
MTISRRALLAAPAVLTVSSPGFAAPPAFAQPKVDAPAPTFTATDSNGAAVALSSFAGTPVVLEWTNDGCPFVMKWYRSGAMQTLQRQAAGIGAVWLSVISSAPGEQGYADGPRANELTRRRNAAPSHVLLDPEGRLGRLYGAQTTPHIYIVDRRGMLVYAGGADSIASTRTDDMAKATPYVKQALQAIAAGAEVPNKFTRPYGCTVKYRDS